MANVSVLDVRLYDEPVGTLTHIGGDRTLFAFNDEYIASRDRPVLGLRFKEPTGELITEFRSYKTQVMPFFSNLLPEGHMRDYLAERAGVNPVREFFLLWALGVDLPGAITITSTDGEDWPPSVDDDLSEEEFQDREKRAGALRFSLAGVQIKFSAVDQASGGLTIPVNGLGGSWIVKLPSTSFSGVPENEFSMMTLARLVGIDVPPIKLVDTQEIENLPKSMDTIRGMAFAIERFDRLSDGSSVHVEDFAQIFGVYPADKYGKASMRNIAEVIATESEEADVSEFIRRLTFNTLIGNADMHLKNWSMIYPDRRRARIAPAYDFVSTISYLPDESAALKFSRTKRFSEFSKDELSHLAAKAQISEKLVLDTAQATVDLFQDYWSTEKANLPLAENVINAIESHLETLPIV